MNHHFDTPVQQDIWRTVRAMNDAWTKGNPDDLVNFFHPQMVAVTATDRLRRLGQAECVAGWKGFAQAATIHHWTETEPLIQVYGESAVVSYYFDMAFTMGGQRIEMGGRDLFFFVREQGHWWAVADQLSAYPAE